MVHMASKETHLSNQISEELTVKRVAGGNIIECRPVFSKNAELLFVVRSLTIQAYSVKTGESVQDFNGLDSKAVGIHIHPFNNLAIVACSELGELIEWDWRTTFPIKKVKLNLPLSRPSGELTVVRGFLLIQGMTKDGSRSCDVLAFLSIGGSTKLTPVVFCSISGNIKKENLNFSVDDHSHSFAKGGQLSGEREYCAGINRRELTTIKLPQFRINKFPMVSSDRTVFTCVACHPEKQIVATGDSKGRILLWYNCLSPGRPKESVYHWHTLPVRDIVFSHAGSHFYSGANECVMVKWTLDAPLEKVCLPRLPGPICHLSIDSDNEFVSISTQDNAIQIVNSQKIVTAVIQQLTWGVMIGLNQDPFVAGIQVDTRTKALVLNGRVGHVQFFCPHKKSLLFNLDITCHNYLTQEQKRIVVNIDVVRSAVSCDGMWLATVEERNDPETSLESRLKFWNVNESNGQFCLNTSIEFPHNGSVTGIAFQPTADVSQMMAVTVGLDSKFRMWRLVPTYNLNTSTRGSMWQCDGVGFHKDLLAGDLGFSHDGSLLAVSFSSTLTVWVPETMQLKCSLTHSALNRPIRQVEFGHKDFCHLVVTASDVYLGVWNLLSLSLLWTVDVSIAHLVSDPLSGLMALFTIDNNLFVFSPSSYLPIYEHKDVALGASKILAAVFAPHLNPREDSSWQAYSQLLFINSDQTMLTLERADEPDSNDGLSVLPPRSHLPLTPFAALIAQRSTSDVKTLKPSPHHQLGVSGADTIKEFLSAPAHTMPSLTLLCGSFLQSLVVTKDSIKEGDTEPVKMDVDSDEDNGNKKVVDKLKKKEKNTNLKAKELEPLLKESYGWVAKYVIKEAS